MVSIHRLGSPTSCAASPIIQPRNCTSCSPGIGSSTTPQPLLPEDHLSRPWPDAYIRPRMARLLRLLPDPQCADESGSVDPPKITLVSLATVAERAHSLQRTAPSWRTKVEASKNLAIL